MSRDAPRLDDKQRALERELHDFEKAQAREARNIEDELRRERAGLGTPGAQASVVPARIEAEVRASLLNDPHVSHPERIAISVDGVGAVVLSGAVDTPSEHHAVIHCARGVGGVLDVIDELKLRWPPVPLRPS